MLHERRRLGPDPASLAADYAGRSAAEIVARAVLRDFSGRIASVSSFGADSAVLLHMISQVAPETPILFLNTGLLFPETLRYRADLVDLLGLRDVRVLTPDPADIASADPEEDLHRRDSRACCALRKSRPLDRGLAPFSAWITGRRRDQTRARAAMPLVEEDGQGRLKINPLADWSAGDLRAYRDAANLPAHPLVAQGFPSIGCRPCTGPVGAGEAPRSGRWAGEDREECGIHLDGGRLRRSSAAPSFPAAPDVSRASQDRAKEIRQ